MTVMDIKVPDIGDVSEVAVIEVLVKVGDTIRAEQSLVTVESDKASMEIPSSHAGVVKALRVQLGDKVAEGTVLLTLEVAEGAAAAPAAAPAQEIKDKVPEAKAPQAPSAIDSVASTPKVTILGENFDAAGVEITFTCLLPGGNTTTVDATAETVLDAQTVTATVPAIGTAGAVCVVRVSNSDGSYFDFSAVSTTNSSRNLNPWAATTSMTEPRRALSLEAGRPTSTSRFLYAIGGDAGTAATAKNTVETTNVSIFGDLSGWTLQRYSLPSPRTLASSAIIGRYGGRVVAQTDDAVSAIFGVAEPDGRDTEVATRCALVTLRALEGSGIPAAPASAGRSGAASSRWPRRA